MEQLAACCRTGRDLILQLGELELPEERRRDFISSINRVACLSGLDPSGLDLDDIDGLRRDLNGIRPAKAGISKKTMANIRASFGAALALVGLVDRLPRGDAACDALRDESPAWSTLSNDITMTQA